ncbi:MauE/DoxX family redox-associated membrane protein [Pedobacter soli]|uniref:Methylamine utilisation protein MauE domain-containing protein n=1 Tax=Pedobacter soli TaxID=390242 RepID=A0A1G6K318_9SPHI|nr:hypothetical protein SAMN04488024_101641 [Pedobacter soli]
MYSGYKFKFSSIELLSLLPVVMLLVLWAYAGFSKLADYHRFVAQMELAPVPLIKDLAPLIGFVVPLVELSLVCLLFTERFRKTAHWLSFFLLLSFTVYISLMLFSGLRLPCTCGGLISKLGWRQHLFFNLFFMLVSLWPFLWGRAFPK